MENQNNITSSDGSEQISLQSVSMPTTLTERVSETTNSSPSGRLVSGASLRKEYIYKERDKYIEDTKNIPGQELMEIWKKEAEMNYPKEGDYVVREGVPMYLGIG